MQVRDAEARRIPQAVEQSLEKLEVIDLILLHGPTAHVSEDWDTLCEQAAKHGIKYVGVSNFREEHLETLEGQTPEVNQIEVSPFLPRTALSHYCGGKGIVVTAHSPLAKGRRLDHPVLKRIAKTQQASPAQVMIAWSLEKGFNPIVRSSEDEHLKQNLEAGRLELAADDVALLNQLEDGYATHPQNL